MTYILESGKELLYLAVVHRAVFLPSIITITSLIAAYLWRRLSLPNVQFIMFTDNTKGTEIPGPESHEARVRIIIRNLDSVRTHGILHIRVSINLPGAGFVAGRHFAGPWAPNPKWLFRHPSTEEYPATVIVRFDGLPPDAAVMFDLYTNTTIAHSHVSISADESINALASTPDKTMAVRNFAPLSEFTLLTSIRYFFWRLVLGLLIYWLAFSLLIGTTSKMPTVITSIDSALFLGGELLVLLSWMVIMPFRGKDVVCGYDASDYSFLNEASVAESIQNGESS